MARRSRRPADADACYNEYMEEGTQAHPGVPEEQYHTLGRKTFWIFLLARMQAVGIFIFIAAVLFVVSDQPFLRTTPVVGDIRGYVVMASVLCLVLALLAGIVITIMVWIIYIHYKFYLGEDSLKIKRGIFNKEEIAIPYRQIQDVDITRDVTFQLLGLSRVIILTAGHEDEKVPGDESEGVFPAIDKDLAEWLQGELLRRANVQKVVEAK